MDIVGFQRSHLAGVIALCEQEQWATFGADPQRAWRALTAPGVITMVARDGDRVVGFAQLQSDGEIQAHLTLIAVSRDHRRGGIGRRLIEEAFGRCGAERIDLCTDSADAFYESFEHRRFSGYRIYPHRDPSHG
jgi:ribosomal protein S18 acetylase RimI-like enzyme